MKLLIKVIGVSVVVGLFAWAIVHGSQKQFIVDCYKWQKFEQDYVLFDLEENLAALCELEGIYIPL